MPKLTPYEIERLENIRRNEKLMKSLGIFQPNVAASSSTNNTKESSSKSSKLPSYRDPKHLRRQSTPLPSSSNDRYRQQPRRSARFSHSHHPDQTINSDPIDFLTDPAESARKPVLLKQLEAPSLPPVDEEWYDPDYRASPPHRDESGMLLFEGEFRECFRPNMTPEEVLRKGSFGGTFFKEHRSSVTNTILPPSDYLSLPSSWISGLDPAKYLTSSEYDPRINRYGVRAGQSLSEWEKSGWIMEQDPRGWFQWYCRFYEGRRTADDWRQVKRWQGVAGVRGRFRRALVKKIGDVEANWDDDNISPIIRQTLQHWAYRLTEEDYEAYL